MIRAFEKFSANIYYCPAGIKTIGYGHVIRAGENLQDISKLEALGLLKQDIIRSENAVIRNINTRLEQSQFDALVSFTFNIGSAALQRSTLRQKINFDADKSEIYNEFIRWVFVGRRKMPGLIRRREIEANLYLGL